MIENTSKPQMETPMSPILYILARSYATDMKSCNPGKLAAQVSHASNQFAYNMRKESQSEENVSMNSTNVNVYPDNDMGYKTNFEWFKEWEQECDGFGTVIVLECNKNTILHRISIASKKYKMTTGFVTDPSYPFIVENDIYYMLNENTLSKEPILKSDGNVLCFREEITCGYILGSSSDYATQDVIGDIPIHR